MNGLISIFDIESQHDEFTSLIECLINDSTISFFIKSSGTKEIDYVEQINSQDSYWPKWPSRPWIVAGKFKESSSECGFSGPFLEDCKRESFNKCVGSLLKHYDWALFSYFTTYHAGLGCLVTSLYVPQIKEIVTKFYGNDVEYSYFESDPISQLRTATFYDYDFEGYFAYELAKSNIENPPLLLCQIDDPELHEKWDDEIEKYDSGAWYKNNLKNLKMVEKFTVDHQGSKCKYLVYEAIDEKSYLNIWAEASEDHSIAMATLSASTDLTKLKAILKNSRSFEVTRDFDDCCDWIYSQVYGGGADEHHAIFRSKDSKNTQYIWDLVGDNQISRF